MFNIYGNGNFGIIFRARQGWILVLLRLSGVLRGVDPHFHQVDALVEAVIEHIYADVARFDFGEAVD